MHPFVSLSKDEEGKPVDQTIYRGMIGSLLYLTTNRPNIIYLVNTINYSLFYKKNQDLRLAGYYDTDYVGDKIERKSTNGGCHFIRPCLVSWASKKLNFIALSTIEVEYVSSASCCSQLLGVAINLSKNPIQYSKAKNIEIRHHFIRDCVQKGIFNIKFINGPIYVQNLYLKNVVPL
ncbi:putative mitochondrial protein, partial [Mucuna pruriens]